MEKKRENDGESVKIAIITHCALFRRGSVTFFGLYSCQWHNECGGKAAAERKNVLLKLQVKNSVLCDRGEKKTQVRINIQQRDTAANKPNLKFSNQRLFCT